MEAIQFIAKSENINAGCVLSCVGSLTNYNIRFANEPIGSAGAGHYEIIQLSGTISCNGCHLHISIGDKNGMVLGGHLLAGNIIYTTAEIIIAELAALEFTRIADPATGWKELNIRKKDL